MPSDTVPPENRWPGHAVLQLPVPPLDDWVRAGFERHDASLLGRGGPDGQPFWHAHATVLCPFDDLPDLSRVEELARQARPGPVRLARVDVFPNGVIHCPPEPDDDLAAMTRRARLLFPGVVPYRGEHPVRPHVTLEAVAPGVTAERVATALDDVLPTTWWPEHLDLVWYEQGNTHLVHRVLLG